MGRKLRDRARYRVDWNNIALGLTIFCLGLAKKVLIADSLSPHVGPVFDAAARGEPLTAAAAWGAAYAYTAQLYFDFSGYSDMAIGLGLLFNLRLPINFAAPLRATSIIDLWRRWHISLSRFLRDFVYVPLGGSGGGPARRTVNLFLTMVLGGLWHGANWTFVLWGAFHGVLLAINHAWRQWRGRRAADASRALRRLVRDLHGLRHRHGAVPRGRSPAALKMFQAMAGFGGAPRAEAMNVAWDSWGMRVGLISEDFVRTLARRQLVGGRHALDRGRARDHLLLVPDTMELTNYREGEPHSDWRRNVGALAWRPSPVWAAGLVVLFVAVYANLLPHHRISLLSVLMLASAHIRIRIAGRRGRAARRHDGDQFCARSAICFRHAAHARRRQCELPVSSRPAISGTARARSTDCCLRPRAAGHSIPH